MWREVSGMPAERVVDDARGLLRTSSPAETGWTALGQRPCGLRLPGGEGMGNSAVDGDQCGWHRERRASEQDGGRRWETARRTIW
ncbi:hypothetical protein E2562_012060 [Oryza meyeriana var. granulata]|uniref:Uncharacterized protein n=1 Tax=Oryza meyeriana var. granulata TaxID=110450 RepID=A0A6G1D2H3_9ORYZ|nr:hypothetical protein E2562_012060 [Oryza meyeriana var. granulata]